MNRRLWLDTRGIPVTTTTRNGENNAIRWGWTPATARPLPTKEEIAEELTGWPIGTGYYQTQVAIDEARDMADVVLALLEGIGSTT